MSPGNQEREKLRLLTINRCNFMQTNNPELSSGNRGLLDWFVENPLISFVFSK